MNAVAMVEACWAHQPGDNPLSEALAEPTPQPTGSEGVLPPIDTGIEGHRGLFLEADERQVER